MDIKWRLFSTLIFARKLYIMEYMLISHSISLTICEGNTRGRGSGRENLSDRGSWSMRDKGSGSMRGRGSERKSRSLRERGERSVSCRGIESGSMEDRGGSGSRGLVV